MQEAKEKKTPITDIYNANIKLNYKLMAAKDALKALKAMKGGRSRTRKSRKC
jgi:hypothetical protein